MSGYIDAIKGGINLFKRGDDDGFDRLSNRYSAGICLLFAFLVSGGQYIGDPIHCWTPNEFSSQWIKYADQYCWIKNTYYVPPDESIPEHMQRQDLEITYYQWTPLILAVQAFLFAIPGFLWAVFASGAGYNVRSIVKKCTESDALDPEKREKVIEYLTQHLDRLLGYRREYKSGVMGRIRDKVGSSGACLPGKRYGNYLSYLYLVTKLFYIGIALTQLFFLNSIIDDDYHLFGVDIVYSLMYNSLVRPSSFFPRVTLCDFKIRKLGENTHNYTVQCVLPWNLFNEKIFIFLWWWLVFVSAMSILGLLVWCYTLIPGKSNAYVLKYLKVMGRMENPNDKYRTLVDEFANRYLRRDGIFVLRMVAKHVNDLTAAELVCSLWDNFIANRAKSVDGLRNPQNGGGPIAI